MGNTAEKLLKQPNGNYGTKKLKLKLTEMIKEKKGSVNLK